jgi:4-carboxymuconolactone decarboxylase
MAEERSPAQKAYGDIAPALADLSDRVLFGEVWERPGLSKRDRSLITVAGLVALYRTNELPGHVKRALDNGVTHEELVELVTHLAFYGGWPVAKWRCRSCVKCSKQPAHSARHTERRNEDRWLCAAV